MSHPLFERHREVLELAVKAIGDRGYWSAFAESPSPRAYGDGAAESGKAAYEMLLGKSFPLSLPATKGTVGGERSPYGMPLGITYPDVDLDGLFAAMGAAQAQWGRAGPEAWVGVSLEILTRLNKRSFEIAHAVMHTTGQAFVMAFQAGCPHAQDRGLEAVAYAWDEMRRVPSKSYWEKPQGKNEPVKMEKYFRIVPRGIGLVIGCNTFPTWNGYPGLFASLATGNAVVVKPHPNAILPLAITVQVARDVLAEHGFDPNVVTLVAHGNADAVAQTLSSRPEVRLIDFTGSSANGESLQRNARQAQVFAEKSGVNQIIIDSVDDIKSVARNIAFSLALYTGQMCTAPQNIYVPRGGIASTAGHLSFDQVAEALVDAVEKLVADPSRAVEILGAIVNDGVALRIVEARGVGKLLIDSRALSHPLFADARIATPMLIGLDAKDEDTYRQEWFGPIAFLVATDSTGQSIDIARRTVRDRGALTLSLYSMSAEVVADTIAMSEDEGVALSINLTGAIFVNQSAAFSDFHGTGANPAANATLTDSAFVASRFRVVQHRLHV